MAIALEDAVDGLEPILFPIVFETPQNWIDFRTISRTGDAILDVYRGADLALYGDHRRFEVVYGAPEAGSIKTWVGRRVLEGVLFGAGFAATQFIDGFVEGVTGSTFRDWGDKAGVYVANLPSLVDLDTEAMERWVTSSMIDAEVCRSFLEMEEDRFEELISERPDAGMLIQNGRRKFYEACRANEQLPAVRFGVSPSSPLIPRSEFSSRTKRRSIHPTLPTQETRGKWLTEVVEITVTSPNWDRLDQHRGWKGKVPDGRYIYFFIADTRFWSRVHDQSLPTSVPDKMVAQVVFQSVGGRYKSAEAIRVLSFNGDDISSPLEGERLATLMSAKEQSGRQHQAMLFDSRDDDEG